MTTTGSIALAMTDLDEAARTFRAAIADADKILRDPLVKDLYKSSALGDKVRAADGLARTATARLRTQTIKEND